MRFLQGCFATVLALIAVFIGTAVLAAVVLPPSDEQAQKPKHEQADGAKPKAEAPPDVGAKVEPKKPQEKPEDALAAGSASASASVAQGRDGDTTVTVTEVVDGDTFDISEPVQGMDRVRLIGVDTPEVYGGEEPCGPEASEYTTRRLEGERVSLEIGEDPEDPYGRLLAYIFIGNEFYNETLVEEGLAKAESYPPNTKYDGQLESAEEMAVAPSCSSDSSASASASESASDSASASASPSGGGKLNNGVDDVNCEDLSGPVQVGANDEDNLDSDGDGVGCDT